MEKLDFFVYVFFNDYFVADFMILCRREKHIKNIS